MVDGKRKSTKNSLSNFGSSLKIKRLIRRDVSPNFINKSLEKHLFYQMEMPFAEAQAKKKEIKTKVSSHPVASQVIIKKLDHTEDSETFCEMYNEIFLAAPDPSRDLSLEEVKLFDENLTFIAKIGSTFAGFVYLNIITSFSDPKAKSGIIAGIGVRPRYRGKKIGLKLIYHAIKSLEKYSVDYLACEVYEKNEPSMKMFLSLGMNIINKIYLEDENTTKSNTNTG